MQSDAAAISQQRVLAALEGQTTSDAGVETAINALSWLIFAGGALTILAAAYTAYAGYGRIPAFDGWSVPDYLATHLLGNHPLSPPHYLWAQHNEHRILIPKLFLLADWRFFHGRDIFGIASIFVIRLLDLTLLAWVFSRLGGLRAARWRTAAGISAVCLFATSQAGNFDSGFQIAFMLPGLFVNLTLLLLLLSPVGAGTRIGWKYVAAIVVMATTATYSLAAGLLVWPLLLLTAVWLRIPTRALGVFFAAAFAVVASYLYHYASPPGHSNPLTAIHHPLAVAEYAAHYLGSPWMWGTFSYPLVFGSLGVALAGLAVGRTLRRGNRDPLETFFVALLLFTGGTSLMTGLGRLRLGTEQASASRYESFSLVFWLSLTILLIHYLATRRSIWFAAVQALMLAVLGLAALRIGEPIKHARARAAAVNSAAVAILTDVFDRDVLRYVSPDPEWTWRDGQFLRQHQLSIFSTDFARHLNEPLQSVYQLRKEDCWGQVLSTKPVGDARRQGLRLRGWAWDRVARRPVREIVLVVGANIVGYGQPGFVQPGAVFMVASRSALYSAWMGYVKTPQPGSTGTVYGVVDFAGKRVCQVVRWPFDLRVRTGEPLRFSTQRDSGAAVSAATPDEHSRQRQRP